MEHYILKGVTDALFLVVQNFHNRTANKNNAGVAPRGVVYTLRSVLRGYVYPHKHTLRCIYIPQRGCFSVCFLLRLWKALNDEQADASTHVFSFVVNRKYYLFVWVKADNYKRTN